MNKINNNLSNTKNISFKSVIPVKGIFINDKFVENPAKIKTVIDEFVRILNKNTKITSSPKLTTGDKNFLINFYDNLRKTFGFYIEDYVPTANPIGNNNATYGQKVKKFVNKEEDIFSILTGQDAAKLNSKCEIFHQLNSALKENRIDLNNYNQQKISAKNRYSKFAEECFNNAKNAKTGLNIYAQKNDKNKNLLLITGINFNEIM